MNWIDFSENVMIIKHENATVLADAVRATKLTGVIDVVGSDEEVAIQYSPDCKSEELIERISQLEFSIEQNQNVEIIEVPVCYELGEDFENVLEMTGLDKEVFIETHISNAYQASFGFIPGFIYLKGLSKQLHCSRKQTPSTKIPAGSVGIGGEKTGVYALESPGGWQIIGRSPLTFFNKNSSSPSPIPSGRLVKFFRISLDEFNDWNGGS
ncbi:MAG: allophanate hydrolase subunit 1 [Cytophagales bacterium]|nr:allophanate hydrolase subunit 1 [Cytophagales bacterium]